MALAVLFNNDIVLGVSTLKSFRLICDQCGSFVGGPIDAYCDHPSCITINITRVADALTANAVCEWNPGSDMFELNCISCLVNKAGSPWLN